MKRGAGALLMAVAASAGGSAQAHLMVAQHGTLNLQGDGGFLVLSLPVSAFAGVDDDGNGSLSFAELKAHQAQIEAMVQQRVRLVHAGAALPLQGLMLQLSPADDAPPPMVAPATVSARQLVVLGRYRLPADAGEVRGLRLVMPLFGTDRSEQQFTLTVTRGPQAQTLLLTPGAPQAALLPMAGDAAAGPLRRALVPCALVLAAAFGLGLGLRGLLRGLPFRPAARSAAAAPRHQHRPAG